MKKIVILLIILLSVYPLSTFGLPSCSATADNGATCSVTCGKGQLAICSAAARSVLCYCEDPAPPPPPPKFELTGYAPGGRDYLTSRLRPFIISLGSPAAQQLAEALDQVISATDANDAERYNEAEWEYHNKREQLSEAEKLALDNWVKENGFYR